MDDSLLKLALRTNAAFSITCGIVLFLFTSELVSLFNGVASVYLYMLAGGLFLFAGYLLWVANQSPINIKSAKEITWMDWGWVAASAVLLLVVGDKLSMFAIDIIIGVAIAVGLCAFFQSKGLRKLRDPGALDTASES